MTSLLAGLFLDKWFIKKIIVLYNQYLKGEKNMLSIAIIVDGSRIEGLLLKRKAGYTYSSLTGPLLAALLDKSFQEMGKQKEVEMSLHLIEDLPKKLQDIKEDVVLFSSVTANVHKVYHTSQILRKKGLKTIIGGPHVSALPLEAINYCDTVIIGLFEFCVDRVATDMLMSQLADFYIEPNGQDKFIFEHKEMRDHKVVKGDRERGISLLVNPPLPRRDLLPSRYSIETMIISRGCPCNCYFCYNSGTTIYRRQLEIINEELKKLGKLVFVVDDNFFYNTKRAREVMQRLKAQKKYWMGFSTLDTILERGDIFAREIRKSGCLILLVGFDSLDRRNFGKDYKGYKGNSDIYERAIKICNKAGIALYGSWVIGQPYDTKESILRTIDWTARQKIQFCAFNLLTPLPGTVLYQDSIRENRIIDKDWCRFDFKHLVILPKCISPEDLWGLFIVGYRHFFSLPSIFSRFGFDQATLISLPVSFLNFCMHGLGHSIYEKPTLNFCPFYGNNL